MKDRISDLAGVIIGRLKASMDEYTYSLDNVSTIQLVVYRVDPIPRLTKAPYSFHLSELDNSEKDLLYTMLRKRAKYKLDLAFKRLIPTTMDESKYSNLVLIPETSPHVPE